MLSFIALAYERVWLCKFNFRRCLRCRPLLTLPFGPFVDIIIRFLHAIKAAGSFLIHITVFLFFLARYKVECAHVYIIPNDL
jgi:hypothetical protein